jgi:hypothetical protein
MVGNTIAEVLMKCMAFLIDIGLLLGVILLFINFVDKLRESFEESKRYE